MAKRILVAVDGSTPAEAALAFATEEWPDATHVLVTVIDPVAAGYSLAGFGTTGEGWYEGERERAEELLEETSAAVEGATETRVEVGRPARAIVDAAAGADVDHVVVGSHGRAGAPRVLLGSVAEAVVRRSPVPVTVVR